MQTDHSNEIDSKTIILAKSGDEAAIAKIVHQYYSYLLFIAKRDLEPSLARRTSPSDIVQDTVAHLPDMIQGFKGSSESELRTWLRVSLNNTLKNTRRYHLQQKRSVANEVKLPSSGFADSSTPSKELQAQERLLSIESGLSGLSEKDQAVLRMRHKDGLAFAEIGDELGVSSDAARMSWGRAIERLKEHIQNNGEV